MDRLYLRSGEIGRIGDLLLPRLLSSYGDVGRRENSGAVLKGRSMSRGGCDVRSSRDGLYLSSRADQIGRASCRERV